jgi:integrase
MPEALAMHRLPKTKAAATTGALALIAYIRDRDYAPTIKTRITVGTWLVKFTTAESSPRAARNLIRGRENSPRTLKDYKRYFETYLKGDPFLDLTMQELDETDAMLFMGRMASTPLQDKRKMAGRRTYTGVVKFVRMAFNEYARTTRRWVNPFHRFDAPKQTERHIRDALTEDEVVSLFAPDVLRDTMERAVCAIIFLAGLRRAEVSALKPEDLDWNTPKILVRRAWQDFDSSDRQLGPTKSKRARKAPFDPVLQAAIRKLWEENGQHEFVFSFKNGTTPGPSWTIGRFHQWLERAGIQDNGRNLVPHSARHSLASMLEARGVPLRYIQDLLDHSDLKTTKIYLHETADTIRAISAKIGEAMGESSKDFD